MKAAREAAEKDRLWHSLLEQYESHHHQGQEVQEQEEELAKEAERIAHFLRVAEASMNV